MSGQVLSKFRLDDPTLPSVPADFRVGTGVRTNVSGLRLPGLLEPPLGLAKRVTRAALAACPSPSTLACTCSNPRRVVAGFRWSDHPNAFQDFVSGRSLEVWTGCLTCGQTEWRPCPWSATTLRAWMPASPASLASR